jgi:hypothetical protein
MEDEVEDPAAEQIAKSARTLLMAAGVAAEQIARARRHTAEDKAAIHGDQREQLQARWTVERSLAIVEVTSADRDWFDRATPQQAGAVWQTAHAWAQVDTEFGSHAERIRTEIEDRYGLDIASIDVIGGDLSGELHAQEQFEQAQRLEQKLDHTGDTQTSNAVLLTSDADYDTERRRQAMGDRARKAGVDADVVNGRVLAANAHARPMREATRTTGLIPTDSRPRQPLLGRDEQLGR